MHSFTTVFYEPRIQILIYSIVFTESRYLSLLPPTQPVSECNFSSFFSHISIVLPGILHTHNKLILLHLFQVFNLTIAIKWVLALPFVGLWIVVVEQVKGLAQLMGISGADPCYWN